MSLDAEEDEADIAVSLDAGENKADIALLLDEEKGETDTVVPSLRELAENWLAVGKDDPDPEQHGLASALAIRQELAGSREAISELSAVP